MNIYTEEGAVLASRKRLGITLCRPIYLLVVVRALELVILMGTQRELAQVTSSAAVTKVVEVVLDNNAKYGWWVISRDRNGVQCYNTKLLRERRT